jgi:hypothetical protein
MGSNRRGNKGLRRRGIQEAAEETLAALRARPNIVFAGIYTADGKLFARYEHTKRPAEAELHRLDESINDLSQTMEGSNKGLLEGYPGFDRDSETLVRRVSATGNGAGTPEGSRLAGGFSERVSDPVPVGVPVID